MNKHSNLASWLEFIGKQHWQSVDLGLERMQAMRERLSIDFSGVPVVTVAGTNGKGSTCIGIEQILIAAGLRVGVTLSPHVLHFNERVRLAGSEADDATLCRAFAAVEAARDGLPLTYFEFSALAALLCFMQSDLDVVVLEIGLGGRLDAFNVIDADIAVITSIGLDHQSILGADREAIGAEKAGILRAGQRVVLGRDMPSSVHAACAALALHPLCEGEDFEARQRGGQWQLTVDGFVAASELPVGRCAVSNMGLAYLACRELPGVQVAHLAAACRSAALPGRLQPFEFQNRHIIADVAHNPAGAAFLRAELEARGVRPACVVCGLLADKDAEAVYAAVEDLHGLPWLLVDTDGERGMSSEVLARRLGLEGVPGGRFDALCSEILSATAAGDVILVFGSFNVVEQCHLAMAQSNA